MKTTDDMRMDALMGAMAESADDVLFNAGLLTERQRVPATGDFSRESSVRQGSFKVGADLLKVAKEYLMSGPDQILFKQVRDHINSIPREKLPEIWGLDNIPDAQDEIARRPRKAFQAFLRNAHKVDKRLGDYIRRIAENVPLVWYAIMVRISGDEMAKIIFQRYFTVGETEALAHIARKRQATEGIDEARSVLSTMGAAVKARGQRPGASFWSQVAQELGYRTYQGGTKEEPCVLRVGGGVVDYPFGRVVMNSTMKVVKSGSGFSAVGRVVFRNVKDRGGRHWVTDLQIQFPPGWEGMVPSEVAGLMDRALADAQGKAEREMVVAVNAKKFSVMGEDLDALGTLLGGLRQAGEIEEATGADLHKMARDVYDYATKLGKAGVSALDDRYIFDGFSINFQRKMEGARLTVPEMHYLAKLFGITDPHRDSARLISRQIVTAIAKGQRPLKSVH